MKKSLVLLMILLSVLSCKKKKTATQAELDEKIITDYISSNNLNATASGSGLYYVISSQGTGIQPNANSNVTVNYKGMLKDGSVFDQTATAGATFNLGSVIKGWKEGMQYYKKGGKGILLIPSALGYGAQATGSIPANSVLIFNIELLNVN
ncbi:MAG: FKBP-type peptidyl-prolyl cis-trans isomerase [Bacteroidia bacterium]